MFQQSRRRFLAGATFIGIGSTLAGTTLLAQTASSIRCEAPVTSKAITGLKPIFVKGGVFQNLSSGRMDLRPAMFGHRTEMRFSGKVGKLAKGIAITPNSNATLLLVYSRGEKQSGDSLNIEANFPSIMLGALYPGDVTRLTLVIPGFKGTAPVTPVNANSYSKTASPSGRLTVYSGFGQIKSKLPKASDFSGKLMLDGKAIAEIKFPKVVPAKIIDALEKEQSAYAAAIASDPALSGDLTYATMPAGCTVTKPSTSSGSGGCYLTTAAVDVVGLRDDCWELRQLRAFRDRFAVSGIDASGMMADYYGHAPSVVSGINARADAQHIWLKAYWLGIVPSAIASQLRLDGIARKIYTSWTWKLQQLAS